MANIKISDLHSAGYELFTDPESYMNQLASNKLDSVRGGGFTNDWGDVIGGYLYSVAGNAALAGGVLSFVATPGTSTLGCAAGGLAGIGGATATYTAASQATFD